MKIRNLLAVLTIISSFAVGQVFANEAKKEATGEPVKAKCCAKAEKDGKKCTHPCCSGAGKEDKNCEKCGGTNPTK